MPLLNFRRSEPAQRDPVGPGGLFRGEHGAGFVEVGERLGQVVKVHAEVVRLEEPPDLGDHVAESVQGEGEGAFGGVEWQGGAQSRFAWSEAVFEPRGRSDAMG